VQRPHRPK